MNSAKLLAHTSLAAGVVFTATAEYSLARRLGAHELVAVMLPVAIDAYAIAALKRFRAFDIALSLMLMGAAQVSAHLLDSHVMPVNGWLVVVVSLLVPTAIWRTHALARDEESVPSEPISVDVIHTETAATVERVPEAYPAIETAVPAAPEAYPTVAEREEKSPDLDSYPEPAVPAVEEPRTRTEVRVGDVPDWTVSGWAKAELGWAAEQFKEELLAGEMPSIRVIKERLSVGQAKAKEIQDGFRDALQKLAGQGATS